MTAHKLLFVCTANICRSPMAAGIAKAYAEDRRWRVEVRSAGVQALQGHPAAPNAVKALREIGIDITDHQSQPMSEELVAWSDRILVMEMRHAMTLRREFAGADTKTQLLGTFGGLMELDDPYGGWMFRYRRSREDIKLCVERFMDRLPPRPLG